MNKQRTSLLAHKTARTHLHSIHTQTDTHKKHRNTNNHFAFTCLKNLNICMYILFNKIAHRQQVKL